ncbi:hypothetical protein THERMOS_1841 [Bathymodiolus thermophilus thioautotrophic gill symbiont]|uniref:Uncharacterized protein n=1 Tax=Bathymodiolus thermophilus thioautotrophic gill symbiont TaxID=2360 RepID=A0A8H9CGD5_9GAMM|nr:hypothetical protein THERMOS_1841 [Bathymodiolus thermophilus thioautotrophic gill symbiont]
MSLIFTAILKIFLSRLCGGESQDSTHTTSSKFLSRLCGGEYN